MLVFSAADFEDFRVARPDLPAQMEDDLEGVVRVLAQNRWPWRMHATYDETISRALDVFEKVNKDIPLEGLNWFFDHAETISEKSMDRIAALGGGIAVQHRMAYWGEYFVERYGAQAAEATPPVAKMLSKGLKVSAGTDATRVASYNPWVSLAWLVTGKTVGGMRMYPQRNLLDRETALRMWTEYVTWFSNEEGKKGRIAVGQLADLMVPDRDFFTCAEDDIVDTTALLTVVGGRIVGAGPFASHDAPIPPAMPDWSPVREYGGYGGWGATQRNGAQLPRRPRRCAVARVRAACTAMRMPARGAARCRPRTRRASGAHSAARAGRSDMTARTAHGNPAWIRALLSQPWVLPLARLALVSAFLIGGVNKGDALRRRGGRAGAFRPAAGRALWAALAIVVEVVGSLCVVFRRFTWLGAGALGMLTLVAMVVANDFWNRSGAEHFMALNSFSSILG